VRKQVIMDQSLSIDEDRINELLSKWNDDERDVSSYRTFFRSTELEIPAFKRIKNKDYMYCVNRILTVDVSNDYDDNMLTSYEKYTDRNLSWSDDDGIIDSVEEDDDDFKSCVSSDSDDSAESNSHIGLVSQKNQDESNESNESDDIVENMIYKKFCYY
jgi:hypothetical protein